MKKGYIAKALFKEGDARESLRVGGIVREKVPKIEFYNPAENESINDKDKSLPTPREIFIADTDRIKESDVLLVELDGEDPGVIYELGLAHGINIALDIVRDIIADAGVEKGQLGYIEKEVTKKIPRKSVYPYLSDIRQGTVKGMKELEVEQVRGIIEEYESRVEGVGGDFGKDVLEILQGMNEEYTQIPSYGLNHYVVGGTQELGSKIYGSVEDAVEGIKKDYN